MPLHRCFIALKISEPVLMAVAALVERLKGLNADVNWVRPGAMHLTLKFLGEIDEDRITMVKDTLACVAPRHPAFTLNVRGVGGFPGLRHPRVVWAGIEDGETLISLQREIEVELAGQGFAVEDRPFRPHLTLGRIREGRTREGRSREGGRRHPGALIQALEEHSGTIFGSVEVRTVFLMESRLLRTGAEYSDLLGVALKAD